MNNFQLVSSSKGKIKSILISGKFDSKCHLFNLIKLLNDNSNLERDVYIEKVFYNTEENDECNFILINNYLQEVSHQLIEASKGNEVSSLFKLNDYNKHFEDVSDLLGVLKSRYYQKSKVSLTKEQILLKQSVSHIMYSKELEKLTNINLKLNVDEPPSVVIINQNDPTVHFWVQDLFISKSNSSHKIELVHNRCYWINRRGINPKDEFVKYLGQQCDISINYSNEIILEGGNTLAFDDRVIFIGKDHFEENNEENLKKKLGVERIIWVGSNCRKFNFHKKNSFQPHYHIDLFMSIANFGKKCVIFLSVIDKETKLSDREKVWNSYIDEIKLNLIESFNSLDTDIEFVEIPIILDEALDEVYSYSNCIMEITDDEQIVYLPKYKMKEDLSVNKTYFDSMFDKVYNSFDNIFSKVEVMEGPENGPDYENFIDNEGSLHCLVKVLDRYPVNYPNPEDKDH